MNGCGNQIDTSVEIVTPENIAFSYWLAGPVRRLPAFLVDCLIRAAVLTSAAWALSALLDPAGLSGSARGLWLLAWFVVEWFYCGLFEALWNGQTPGKRLLRLRVIAVSGEPINAWQAVLRNVLRAVDGLPMLPFMIWPVDASLPLYVVGLIAATLNDRFQRLGDMAAGTMVVIDETARLTGVFKFRSDRVQQMADAIPAGFQMNRSLGQALSLYVARRAVLSRSRRLEIARYLGEPLRRRFNLPRQTNNDLLLCGLYQKAFLAAPIGDAEEEVILEPAEDEVDEAIVIDAVAETGDDPIILEPIVESAGAS